MEALSGALRLAPKELAPPEAIIDDLRASPSSPVELKESDARKSIAISLVATYMGLLVLSVAVPVLMYLLGPEAVGAGRLSAIKELSGPISAAVTSVTGVIGFVLGYYFKSQESRSK